MRIVLVNDSQSQVAYNAPARALYTGALFRAARAYAEQYGNAWFILSAQYGVLHPETRVGPYALSLAEMTERQRAAWNAQVQRQLVQAVSALGRQGRSLENPHWVILAEDDYRQPLTGFLAGKGETPLAGMEHGQQIAWLNQQTTGGNDDNSIRTTA